MVQFTLKIEEEEEFNYLFNIEVSYGSFKSSLSFNLSEENFNNFIANLNSPEKSEILGDVSNGHEEINFEGNLITVYGAHYYLFYIDIKKISNIKLI